MEETITATEANRNFSHLLSEVKNGKRFAITSHGEVIAHLAPVDKVEIARREAWDSLLKRLQSQPAMDTGPWTRDELYEK